MTRRRRKRELRDRVADLETARGSWDITIIHRSVDAIATDAVDDDALEDETEIISESSWPDGSRVEIRREINADGDGDDD
ncbi:hypothetical protein [Natrinema sp. 1APR25-10V2]|uniref:hypothetical protein n=1 Tax=Natrinema sp. 1APR25-10V2 TaxID=2951081 RepID=UPI002875C9EB|nr:hypothetical protein [Natrinema sp. 1APR25-10V2]MDS0477916.1 hypothetical protein [Natrinema sp. 1APR25-10V2]